MSVRNLEVTAQQQAQKTAGVLQPLQLPQDIESFTELVLESFKYPENPEWNIAEDERDQMLEAMKVLKLIWPLLRVGMVFSPPMRDLFRGYFWVEDGARAGMVMAQRRGSSQNWMIGNVATLPAFRRRGIGRKLVEAAVDLIVEHGGMQATLDVISGNLPAYKLYESLGFSHFVSSFEMVHSGDAVTGETQLPDGYRLEPTTPFEWKPRFELMQRITPPEVQDFEPVSADRYKVPGIVRLIMPLMEWLQKVEQRTFFIWHEAELVGRVSYSANKGKSGRHDVTLVLDPAHGVVALPVLTMMVVKVQALKPGKKIETSFSAWNQAAIDAAREIGFTTRLEFHRMGLKLEKER